METETVDKGVARRTVVKGVAWSIPLITLAAVTPQASASARAIDGFQVEGTCDLLGTLGAGFTVKAGATPIPVGTQIVISTSGPVSLDLVSLTGQGVADITLPSRKEIAITLTQEIPSDGQLNVQWLLSGSLLATTTATLMLPEGTVAGANAKSVGTLHQAFTLCSGS